MSRTPVNSQSNSDSFKKLQEKLKEMFLLDRGDLDFGIYRIMQSNRDKIEKFLNDDLLPQVKTALTVKQSAHRSLLQKQMDEAISQARSLGVDPEAVPKIHDMRQKLTESVDLHKIENEIYSDLYNFFKRYYSEGDFLSLRRYKEGVYALPYEGEEVKLHWANADQYYIKSTENLSSYVFRTPSNRRVRFEVVEGHTEQNNNKAEAGRERRFMLVQENPVTINQGDVILRFEYKPDPYHREQWRPKRQAEKQTLNEITVETVKKCLSDQEEVRELFFVVGTDNKPDRTLLEKHLDCFTARNTFDYFIHKDLGAFLRRELDFYIKNEIMYLDDIENESVPRVEQYLSKIKVLRLIAGKIIRFLEQLENFQKKLWLKKKFVLETQYCMTLDRIPESFYAEIAANEEQRKEWVRLFAIDEISEDPTKPGYGEPLTIDFLKENHLSPL